MEIELIKQKHKYGCLAACVAMVTQEPYRKIYPIIGESTLLDAIRIISKYKSCQWISIYGLKKKDIPLSILTVGNHAVLWNPYKKKIYDPVYDNPQKFENYQYNIIGLKIGEDHHD